MVKQVINVGGAANDGTGDTLRAGAQKINDNFDELYNLIVPQVNSDWNAVEGVAEILNKPELFSGSYTDLSDVPNFASVATTGDYTDLSNKPDLALVAVTGSYADLLHKPAAFSGDYEDLNGKPTLSSVATTGSYNDLTFKPTIPTNTNQLSNGAGFITSSALVWGAISGRPDTFTPPIATVNTLGGVKVDGTTINIDGNGVISAIGGGGGGGAGLTSRATVSVTTASIAPGASTNATITGYKGYALLKVQTSAAAWVSIYSSVAARTADASRDITVDPTPGSGVIAEVVTTGAQTQSFTPAVIGFSDEGTPSSSVQIKVYNNGATTAAITVTLTLLQLEV